VEQDAWWPQQRRAAWGPQQWSAKDAAWRGPSSSRQSWWSGPYGYETGGAAKPQQSDRRGAAAGWAKSQGQFFIGIEEDSKFKVTRKVLGPHGQHMKTIAEASGAKLRLRGRGSGFLEGPERRESEDELMLCVSAADWEGYQEAVRLVRELLERVYGEYRAFCQKSGIDAPHLKVNLHDGPRPGSR